TEHLDILYLLTSLVDKSLIYVVEETPTETRFLLLETIREYALECLTRQYEEEETRRLHASFYLSLAEEVEPQLQGGGQQAGLQRLDRESANLRAALRWSIECAEAGIALRLASALREYLLLRDAQSAGSQWFEEVLAMPGAQEVSASRVRVLYAAGALARLHSDLELARTRLNESREVARQVDDRHTLALVLGMLAQLELYPGNYTEARALVEEGLQVTESTNDRWGRGILHRICGNIASMQGDFNTALTRYSVSLMLLREVGDRRNEAETLVNLGSMMRLRGKLRTAHYLYAKGLQLFRELNDRWGQLTCLNGMGEALRVQGDYSRARASFEEALALAAQLGERAERAAALTGLGQLLLRQNQHAEAAQNLKEALHIAREINYTQGLGMALCRLGDLERSQGNWSSATSYYQQGLDLARGSGDKLLLILLLVGQGDAARAQGKYALACAHIKQSLHLAWEIGNHIALTAGLEALAWLCVQAGQPEHGALLLGAAHELRETMQTPLAPVYQVTYTRDLAALKAAIGQDAFAECWAEGRALLLPQIMAIAVAQVHITETSSHIRERAPNTPYNLTARELDVLRLLAEGHADARIAKLLVVSPRTINTHLRSIYARLGVSTRSAATRIALEQKLV
ncbi:MAG: tetratricopeptide repeat protein, partial [Ktedonobacteraceae bacterium]